MILANPMVFRQLPLEDALSKTRELGFRAVELWPPQLSAVSTPALRRRLADYLSTIELQPIRLNCADPEYFRRWTADYSFDSILDYFKVWTEDYSFDSILDGLRRDIDFAHDLGMTQVLTWEGRPPAGLTREQKDGPLLDAATELFTKALAHARERNISLSLEIHPFTIGIDLAWTLTLCERLNANDFGVTYDCCHFAVGLPRSYIAAIKQLGRWIKHVHFSDSDLVTSEVHYAPTTGHLDLLGIIDALREIKFSGTTMLDLWLDPLPEQGARLGMAFLEKHYPESTQ